MTSNTADRTFRFKLKPTRAQHDLAYLAGFFDGEGCVYINRNKPNRWRGMGYHLEISFTNGDPAPLLLAQEMFGGQVTTTNDGRAGHKTIHRLRVRCLKAKTALEAMLPYLRVKGERALKAIEFQSRKSARSISLEEMEGYRLFIRERNDKVWNREEPGAVNVDGCVERSRGKAAA